MPGDSALAEEPSPAPERARPPEPAGTPKYVLIAEELRTLIMSGAAAPGSRLPGENELMRRHGVARMTARQALAVLQSEGLTVARRGAGVFVRDVRPVRRRPVPGPNRPVTTPRPPDDPLLPAAPPGAGEPVAAPAPLLSPFPTRNDGHHPALDRVEVYQDAAGTVVAGALGVAPGTEMWVRNRRFVLDGKPVMIATSYLPAQIVGGSPITERDAGPGGAYARLAELGHAPVRCTEELRARMPLRQEAADLRLPAGTAVIVLCRTAFDVEDRPLEFTTMTMDADAHVLEYAVDLTGPSPGR